MDKSISRKDFLWNTLGSISFASLNFIFTFMITKCLGVEESGKFSLAFSNAQILYTLGLFGVDALQMTDFQNTYSFSTYLSVKLISSFFMLFGFVVYLVLFHYVGDRAILLLLMTTYFAVYSFAEVFQAQFFIKRRLDLSGKSLFYRTVISILAFGITIVMTLNVKLSVCSAIIVNLIVFFIVSVRPIKKYEEIEFDRNKKRVIALLKIGFPLCISNFVFTFLNNSAKYSIDYLHGDYLQGVYNILYIPVMSVVLLCSFIYKPMLLKIYPLLEKHDFRSLLRMVRSMFSIIGLLGITGLFLAHTIGIPIMSFVFSVDLINYRFALTLMIFASVLIAVTNILYYIIVALRKGRIIFFVAISGTCGSLMSSVFLVKHMGVAGGFMSLILGYTIINIFMIIVMYITLKKEEKYDCCKKTTGI